MTEQHQQHAPPTNIAQCCRCGNKHATENDVIALDDCVKHGWKRKDTRVLCSACHAPKVPFNTPYRQMDDRQPDMGWFMQQKQQDGNIVVWKMNLLTNPPTWEFYKTIECF